VLAVMFTLACPSWSSSWTPPRRPA